MRAAKFYKFKQGVQLIEVYFFKTSTSVKACRWNVTHPVPVYFKGVLCDFLNRPLSSSLYQGKLLKTQSFHRDIIKIRSVKAVTF